MAKPPATATAAELIPRLALVPGEPAGIGPELCVRLVQRPRTDCRLIAFGDAATLQAAARALDLPLRLLGEHESTRLPGDLCLRAVPNAQANQFGTPDPGNAAAVIHALQAAADACLTGYMSGCLYAVTCNHHHLEAHRFQFTDSPGRSRPDCVSNGYDTKAFSIGGKEHDCLSLCGKLFG